MEMTKIRLGIDDASWQAAIRGEPNDELPTLPDGGDVTVLTKDHCTTSGRPGVCITFTVKLPDGKLAKAQTVITGRNFAGICAAFRGRYGVEGDSVQSLGG